MREGVKTTPQPVFAMQKCAINGYKKELTITEYSLTPSTKVNYKIQKEMKYVLGIASAW